MKFFKTVLIFSVLAVSFSLLPGNVDAGETLHPILNYDFNESNALFQFFSQLC